MNKEVVKLSDEEVIKRCDFLIQDFCDNGFTSGEWHMSIPARPNLDADLVFSTLIHRFQEMLKELEAIKKEREAAVKLIEEYSDVIEGSTPFLNSLSKDKEQSI